MDVRERTLRATVKHSDFEFMRRHASKLSPILDEAFEGGAKSFINKGTSKRWRDVLTYSDNLKYEITATENLSEVCAHWLATGEIAR